MWSTSLCVIYCRLRCRQRGPTCARHITLDWIELDVTVTILSYTNRLVSGERQNAFGTSILAPSTLDPHCLFDKSNTDLTVTHYTETGITYVHLWVVTCNHFSLWSLSARYFIFFHTVRPILCLAPCYPVSSFLCPQKTKTSSFAHAAFRIYYVL